MRALSAAVVLLVVTAGCGSGARHGASTEPSVTGRTWVSTSVSENGRPKALVPGTQITVTFSAEGRVGVEAGCNHMGGPVTFAGRELVVRAFASTAIGCPDGRNAQDEWVSAFLMSRPTWSSNGRSLTLRNSTISMVLTAQR